MLVIPSSMALLNNPPPQFFQLSNGCDISTYFFGVIGTINE